MVLTDEEVSWGKYVKSIRTLGIKNLFAFSLLYC